MKDLNDSLAKLSVKNPKSPVHLTSEDARAIQDLAGGGQSSAMNRYMEMKNKQELEGMENSSSAH